jgi:hypothetical protein|tara:strand:+ start:1863 stop:2138 length:276 start_codon:yes stop_codon:yes gene_type:complete
MDRDAAERIKNELLRKMKDMSNTIADSYSDFSHGKPVFCDASIVQARMAYCNACEHYNNQTTQCGKCGCFMSAKARLKQGSCPIGKWGKDT